MTDAMTSSTGEARRAAEAVLVSTHRAEAHIDDPAVRMVEVDVDTSAYDKGHVPGVSPRPRTRRCAPFAPRWSARSEA